MIKAVFPILKSSTPIEMISIENYLHKLQETKFKIRTISFIKEFKELKEETKEMAQ